ncbi:sporulation protein YunB [Paenibacillus thermotolerans]|uniref:sporulation protein YunB n=1 Tax=Paenibacillus thermotolerans TaxID=3027807 RepID=UPI002368D244|nr:MULTISPECIES: sporulation protein YunB [unclassified Paenibacillus]
MRRRGFRSRSAKPFSRKTIFLLSMVIMLIFSMQSFIFIEKNLREPLMDVARIRVRQVATDAINQAIADQVAQEPNTEHLVDWVTNKNGDIASLTLNYAEHMRISSQVVNIVRNTLGNSKHLVENVPVGQALDSAILSSFGPSIPIRFEAAGAPQVDLGTKKEDAGINMLLITVFVRVTAEVMIYIPFATAPEIVTTEIPISYILVNGDVPNTYFNSGGSPRGGAGAGAGSGGVSPPTITVPAGGNDAPASERHEEEPVTGQ